MLKKSNTDNVLELLHFTFLKKNWLIAIQINFNFYSLKVPTVASRGLADKHKNIRTLAIFINPRTLSN